MEDPMQDPSPRTRAGRWLARRRRARPQHEPAPARAGALGGFRALALWATAGLVAAASLASFTESYRGLYGWATGHGLHGVWAGGWPLQVDVFIAVGELALFVGLADGWERRSRVGAWAVTLAGLAVSVAGNVGHIATHALAARATAGVPPVAAASALAVGLGVLKRVVAARAAEPRDSGPLCTVPSTVLDAAKASMAATAAAGNPLSRNQLQARFGLTRAQADEIVSEALPSRGRGGASIAPVPVTSTSGPPAGAAQEGRPPSEHSRLGAQPAAGMNGAGGHG